MTDDEFDHMTRTRAASLLYDFAQGLDAKIKQNGETLKRDNLSDPARAFLEKRIGEQQEEQKRFRVLAREISSPNPKE